MATSPTPSEENRQNSHDASMYAAIDKMLGQTEQSYEDFIKTFPHCIAGSTAVQPAPVNELFVGKLPQRLVTRSEKEVTTDRLHTGEITSNPHGNLVARKEENFLEQEVLGEGERCSRMTTTTCDTFISNPVQIDNYVDNCDSDDQEDEDLYSSGYTASFLPLSGSDVDSSCKAPASMDHDPLLPTRKTMSCSVIDGKSTLPASTTDQSTTKGGNTNTDVLSQPSGLTPPVLDHAEMDNLLNGFMKDLLEEEGNSNQEHDADSIDTTQTDCIGADVTHSVEDIEGDGRYAEMCDEEEKEELEKRLIFPGEVEDVQEIEQIPTVTMLDFTASYRDTPDTADSEKHQVCSDTVEVFRLDEGFDYDNVLLTPKYSLEELRS